MNKIIIFIILIIFLLYVYLKFIIEDFKVVNSKDISTLCIGKIDKIFYLKNVLSEKEYNIIKEETTIINSKLNFEETTFRKIYNLNVDKQSILYNIFYGEKFLDYLYKNLGFRVKPLYIVPIDYRVYKIGHFMNWHRDSVISINKNCPQIEVVYTIENKSDSQTEWIDDNTNIKNIIVSEPNTIMITQGGSVFHYVSPVTKGYRSIIKIAYDVA